MTDEITELKRRAGILENFDDYGPDPDSPEGIGATFVNGNIRDALEATVQGGAGMCAKVAIALHQQYGDDEADRYLYMIAQRAS